ncbi:acylphosphatase-2-like [Glossina fuscipes]|uniref:acylphosphatase n=1 Tax=Glossina fuscipes TaxID=7396 RepID=A0A9C6E3J5_9MUSC|nr:acylphosphatase-2-like [Glossina fuscipes]
MGTRQLYACDFEVFGKVQRVFFRKYTANKAKDLGLHGWCKNTSEGSVKGQMEGTQQELNEMKYWLQHRGSPKSRIDGVNFSDMIPTNMYTLKSFEIRK